MRKRNASKSNFDKLKNIERIFNVSLPEIKRFIRDFRSEMEKGLKGQQSSLVMLPTYVEKPTGEEKGNFLAIDLGGTNLRVAALKLKGERKAPSHISEKFALKDKHIKSSGDALFDFVADCVKNFIIKHGMDTGGKNDIGFTFSFPVKQSKISSGVLIRWTKGFSVKGVEGKDVVGLLNDSLKRKGLLGTKAVAIINDTVATLVAKSYEDPDCDVGVILGTGTNACYCENDGSVINIEWGNFNKLRLTAYDKKLDRLSEYPGEQILEKMISGMYLGKLVGLVLEGFLKTKVRDLKTEYITESENDNTKNLSRINTIFKKMGMPNSEYRDRKILKSVSRIVSKRAARLGGGALAAVITRIDPGLFEKHTIAVDGSLYEKHPAFSRNIKITLREIFGKKAKNISLKLAKDASVKGAAIIAAIATG